MLFLGQFLLKCHPQGATVKQKQIPFKVDTGAELTAISDQVYHILNGSLLKKPTRVIYGPAWWKLEVLGQID